MDLSKLLKPRYLLVLICILFFITRLYKIDQIPPSVYWDEASIGYNAYSLAQDGKDEWGKFLPIHFRAFGEFKLPVYIYSVVPFVKIFGLNEFTVRFPAVFYSLATVLLTYMLTKKIFKDEQIGIWSSFLLTISPWFFIFSRTGYEATAGLMFYLLGIYLFFKLSKDKYYLIFSIIAFIISAYSYNSFRIIIPLTVFILTIFERNSLMHNLKGNLQIVLISLTFILISIIPIYRLYKYDGGNLRLQTVAIKNKSEFFSNYLSHFNPKFLFIGGDKNLRSQQKGFGQLYTPDFVLILIGLTYIIGRKSKRSILFPLLLLLGPMPAALTKESPHALRSLSVAPFYSILSASGIFYIRNKIKVNYLEIFFIAFFLVFFARYFINFLNVYPTESLLDWQYPYKIFYLDYQNKFSSFDHIIISDEYAQPYIFALFYLKYNPEEFRKEVKRNSVDQWGFSTVSSFGKFEFGKADKLAKKSVGKNLILDVSNNNVYEQENY